MLRSVNIRNYKNYRQEFIEFSERFALINGDNGSGKTNLIDSIYYICMCKSYFTRSDALVMRSDETYFRLEAIFENDTEKLEVICKYVAGKQKEFIAGGITYDRLSEHIGRFPVVIITPNDIDLIYKASDERRRFLDIAISQLDNAYLIALLEYNRVLQQRNALLKNFESTSDAISVLQVFDKQLSKAGIVIHVKRKNFIKAFEPIFYSVYNALCQNRETPVINYSSQLHAENFATLLSNNRSRDIESQRSTVGIHKDELEFSLNGLSVKESASQGQVKSVLLALKLAQFLIIVEQTGKHPILLLDDVFEKLDTHRLKALFQLLKSNDFNQVLITDADAERSKRILSEMEIIYNHFTVSNGQIV